MRNHRVFCCLGGAFAVCLLLSGSVKADDLYGKIRGTVSDTTGAVIAGATLTATNAATGFSKSVASASDGSYELFQLPAPANYKVSVRQSGFRSYEVTGINLGLNQIYVLNVTLEVGAVTQRLTVEAAPVQVERTSMQLGGTLTSSQIIDLPLNGRNWVTLQQTLPGVVTSDRFTTNFATSGSRAQANNYLVNGIDANDLPLNTPVVVPSPDAIAEVSMITNTINPEYGRNGGAIMNATTKSGSNTIHGSGFDFFRDNALNTRNFFSPSRTVFHQNQFGGTVGGPIKKDKAFFFFSYQGTRNRQPQAGGSVNVFTLAQRTGDFSAARGALTGVSPIPLIDENGVTQPAGTMYSALFPTKHIPTADFNPISARLLSQFVPPPNSGATFQFNPIQAQVTNQYMSRIDYNYSDKDSIFGSWFIEPTRLLRDLPFTGSTLPGFGDRRQARTQQYVLNWNHTFSGTTLNELRVGYQRLNFNSVVPQNPVLPSSAGFTGITPQNTKDAGLPRIRVVGLFNLGFSSNGPQPRIDQTYQVNDNFSKIIGRHAFKAGFSMLRGQVWNPFFGNNNGNFLFGGSNPAFSTGNAGLDFLLGFPDSYGQGSGGFIDARTQTYYSYGQDQWKVRPNLTLTYGVGWQIDTPISDIANGGVAVECFRPGQQSKVFPTAPAGLVFPGDPSCNAMAGAETRLNHFAPRIGFAWSPRASQKWAIRGGYGIYYNRVEEELQLQFLNTPPFSLISAGVSDDPSSPSPSFANPFSGWALGSTGAVIPVTIPNKFPFSPPTLGSPVDFTLYEPFSLNVVDPNLSDPYSQNFNLTIERELPGTMIFSASYVGLLGRKLTNTIELNPAGGPTGNPVCQATPGCSSFTLSSKAPQTFRFPQTALGQIIFGSVAQQATFISSSYNALQLVMDKKTSHGLNFRAAYSWSHSLDGSSSFEDLGFSGVRGLDPFDLRNNYGDSAFDARQRFVFSSVYAIPSARHFSGLEKLPSRLTDGWRITGIVTFQSGIPVTVGSSSVRSKTCNVQFEFYSCWDRPNVVSPVSTFDIRTSNIDNSLNGTISPFGPQDHYWFDPNAFAREPLGTMGNAGRNFFRGPGINNVDFSLMKDTRLTESSRLELRFEFFNGVNHALFNPITVNTDSASRSFGRDINARPFNFDSRIVQVAAKIYF